MKPLLRSMILAGVLLAGATLGTARADTQRNLEPGEVLDARNWQKAQGLLPPEILEHYKKGEYANPVMAWPEGLQQWGQDFRRGTEENRGRFTVNDHGTIIDKASAHQPPYIIGLPFPAIDPADGGAAIKILWNYYYQYWYNGNSHNVSVLEWLSPKGLDRRAVEDTRFLYYDGQPRALAPHPNPQNLQQQFLAVAVKPADLQGTASLVWRFRSPRRDLVWAYVPALRRVRQVSPTNRSDGFLGSDMSQDDGPFFDGKPEDFTWKLAGQTEMLRFVDPYSLRRAVTFQPLPGGGWRALRKHVPHAGYQVSQWKGLAWAPVSLALAKRKMWIIEGTPKDKYYLYGRIQLLIDKETFDGAWNRKFGWKGELLNVYFNSRTLNSSPDGKIYFSTNPAAVVIAENLPKRRATLAGQPTSDDVPFDYRVQLSPSLFDYQNLLRFGK
ncbi:MAG: outer membrane lipoprotein-sorting protein [Candidatus Binatia bacterium]